MKKDRQKGKVDSGVLRDLKLNHNISSGLIGAIMEIDIEGAIMEKAGFSREIWDYPAAFMYKNLENNTDHVMYATKIRQNKPKNVAVGLCGAVFTQEGPVQELLIDPQNNYIELKTEGSAYWHKINAIYDANNKIVEDSIVEEMSTPWSREKREFLNCLIGISFISGRVLKVALIFGIPIFCSYLGVKIGSLVHGCFGVIFGSVISGLYMASGIFND